MDTRDIENGRISPTEGTLEDNDDVPMATTICMMLGGTLPMLYRRSRKVIEKVSNDLVADVTYLG
jgi:hypothetical protein